MDLKYKIHGSDKVREKLMQKITTNPDYELVIELDQLDKLGLI